MVTNSFGNRNFMQPREGSACTQCALIFFLLSFRWGGKDFFHFFIVPNMFLSSSQWVPIKGVPIVP